MTDLPAWPGSPSGGSDTDLTALEGAAGDVLIGFRETGDADTRLEIHGDGSLHWGDGAAEPDVSISRTADEHLLVNCYSFDLNWAPDEPASSFSPSIVFAGPQEGMYAYTYVDAGLNALMLFVSSQDGGSEMSYRFNNTGILDISVNGGGIKLKSPNGGTTKTLTIDNAGALALL